MPSEEKALQSQMVSRGVRPLKAQFLASSSSVDDLWARMLMSDLEKIVDVNEEAPSGDVKLLQIEDVVNVGDSEPRKDTASGPTRVLKLALSDGVQRMTAVEYEPIAELSVKMLPGTKILLTKPLVKRGCFFLTKESTTILPGYVSELADHTIDSGQADQTQGNTDLRGIAELEEEHDEDLEEFILS
mmetsp:Transcript_4933/g.14847  ORF Transcript_4933/g.14847 Transcript_4933/m.14847 type:complete len:187 (-) Transcript_4933:144-704(-)